MKKQNNLLKGLMFALVTAIISGFAIFYSKISVAKIDPLVMATARNMYVGMVFFVGMLIFGKLKELKKIPGKEVIPLLVIGIIGGGLPFYLFFTGLQSIGAQSANIIHKSLFIWVSILGMFFLKEKLNIIYIAAYILVFAGTYFFTPLKFILGTGSLMVMAATIMWSVENIVAKKVLKTVSSETVGLFRMGVGALFLLIMTIVTNKSNLLISLNRNQVITIVIGATILCFYVYFWYKSLKFAPANLVALILSFSVVVGNILNGSFAGIALTQKDLLSTVFIAAGVLAIYLFQLRKKLNKV